MHKSAIFAVTALLANPVLADKHQPFYVGGGLGNTNWQGVCPSGGSDRCDDNDMGYDIYGGYRFNRNIAVELGFTDIGEGNWRSNNAYRNPSVYGVRLAAVATIPLTYGFSVSGEVGVFGYQAKMDSNTVITKNGDREAYIGAGINYRIIEHLEVGFRWRHFRELDFNDTYFNRHSANYWGLQLSYLFGGSLFGSREQHMPPPPPPKPQAAPPPPPVIVEQIEVIEVIEIPPSTVIYFDNNSSTVSGSQLEQLAEISRYLRANPSAKAELVGHTDRSGNAQYNKILGERRAMAVEQILESRYGISPNRVTVVSAGAQGAVDLHSRSERKVTVNIVME
ncbi:MAG: OmpA family protein [Ferrimonas sp.]